MDNQTKRKKLAAIAQIYALKPFHGFVMSLKPNIDQITELFPPWSLRNWDNKWCAAFVYFCCRKAGFNLPVRHPNPKISCNFAGCGAWLQWAQIEGFYSRRLEKTFKPITGDIVLYDHIFEDKPHDHIGIIIEADKNSVRTAEGNVNNISTIIKRPIDSHIRGYIRIPENYHF